MNFPSFNRKREKMPADYCCFRLDPQSPVLCVAGLPAWFWWHLGPGAPSVNFPFPGPTAANSRKSSGTSTVVEKGGKNKIKSDNLNFKSFYTSSEGILLVSVAPNVNSASHWNLQTTPDITFVEWMSTFIRRRINLSKRCWFASLGAFHPNKVIDWQVIRLRPKENIHKQLKMN